MKLFKRQEQLADGSVNYFEQIPPEELRNNADYLMDQWDAAENINLDGKAVEKKDLSYHLSNYLPDGEYYIVPFFQSAHKFNYLGLPFTNDVTGSALRFTLKNSQAEGSVLFDINSVKVNGDLYNFVGFIKSYSEDEDVVLNAPLKNTTGKAQDVKITWNTYYWDNMRKENRIDNRSESVQLAPGETKNLEYKVKKNSYPVNYVVVTADQNGAKSVLDIRFARNTKELVRINSQGLDKFPLQKGEDSTIYLTAHAVKQNESPYVQLPDKDGNFSEQDSEQLQKEWESKQERYAIHTALSDEAGNVIQESDYSGIITGDVMGFEQNFKPDQAYNYVVLTTEIKNNEGEIIDQNATIFDCSKINSIKCSANTAQNIWIDKIVKSVFFLALIMLLGGLGHYAYKKKKNNPSAFMLALLIISAGLLFCGSADVAQAKSVAVSQPYVPSLAYLWGVTGGKAWAPVGNISGTVKYSSTSTAGDAYRNVSPGDVFWIEDSTHTDSNSISWYMTGLSGDTPPGFWRAGASGDSLPYYRLPYTPNPSNTSDVDVTQSLNPPDITISTSGPVSCVQDGYLKWRCTVLEGGGEISINVRYGSTYGYYYYKSSVTWDPCSLGGPDCSGSGDGYACVYQYCETTETNSGKLQSKIRPSRNFVFYYSGGCDYLCTATGCSIPATRSLGGPNRGRGVSCAGDYTINIPGQVINYRYNAGPANTPPTSPHCINCPGTLNVNTDGTFTIGGSTDAEGDQIIYQIEWDPAGAPGLYEDSNSGPASGFQYATLHQWITSGLKSFRFRAIEALNPSNASAWVDGSVAILEIPVDGACKTPPNNSDSFCPGDIPNPGTMDAGELCNSYDPANPPSVSGTWNWTCSGQYGGSSANCRAIQAASVVAACGSDVNFCTDNTSNPCVAGNIFSGFSNENAYSVTWTCTGRCPTTSVSCTAPGKKSCGWIETNPSN
ncbi:MAG: hypothetical protein PHF35_01590 [Candidatus Moranbacteria bacterium]|nr:hypothetical protein [Candidatus Moranbacteria bacterium]